MTAERRPLSDQEVALLLKILGASPAGEEIATQVPVAVVVDDSVPTFLDLAVSDAEPADGVPDGPLPGRYLVYDEGRPLGEVIVWVKGGRLTGLEYAWVTDEMPDGFPNPENVVIQVDEDG